MDEISNSGKESRQVRRSSARPSAGAPQAKQRKGCLRIVLIIAVVVVVLLAVLWLVVTRHLGGMMEGVVRDEVAKAINGRLEFEKLEIDLAGRAVLTEASVFAEDDPQPLLTCPEIVIGFDLVNLIGPNRGRKSLEITLDQPKIALVRNSDGSFNAQRLAKPRSLDAPKQDIGIAVRLKQATVDFTDWCLLNQNYPVWPDAAGLVGDLRSELGYSPTGPEWQKPHEETLVLDGSADINVEREELAFDLQLERAAPGGQLRVRGDAVFDGAEYEVQLDAANVELKSAKAYIAALAPRLQLLESQAPPEAARNVPWLAGQVESAKLKLEQVSGSELAIGGQVKFNGLAFDAASLTSGSFSSLAMDYDAGKQLLIADFELDALKAHFSGKPRINFADDELRGKLEIKDADLGEFLTTFTDLKLAASGTLSAKLDLDGSLSVPAVSAELSGSDLRLEGADLGNLAGSLDYAAPALTLKKISFAGGALPVQASGTLNLDTRSGALKIETEAADLQQLQQLANKFNLADQLPALESSGQLSTVADLRLVNGEFTAVTAQLNGKNLAVEGIALGSLSGAIAYAAPKLTLDGIQFRGGDLPISGSGTLDLKAQSGSLKATTGPADIQKLLKVAAKLSPEGKVPTLDAKGQLSAAAEISLTGGTYKLALIVSSDKLVVSGLTLANLKATGQLAPPNINLTELTCTVNTNKVINQAGLSSDGNLKLGVRASGSISQLKGDPAVLSIIGEAKSTNLSPDQMNIAFKVIGPSSDPELRFGLKTTANNNPLSVQAQTHYRQGYAPLTATLSWFDTKAEFAGEIDFGGERIKGELLAKEVDLGRFSPDPNLGGLLSATATVGGTFSAPSVEGEAEFPQVDYQTPQRTYNLRDGFVRFKLEQGNQLSVSKAGFKFEGNEFTASGSLGAGSGDITATCPDFNLFSVLALVPTSTAQQAGTKATADKLPIDIQSSGPFSIHITGELADPTANVTYATGAGSVAGNAFSSAKLSAEATLRELTLNEFQVMSSTGSINATGSVVYRPMSFQANAKVHRFDIGVLTPLTGTPLLDSLSGYLDGELGVTGKQGSYSLGGELELVQGSYQAVEISEAYLRFGTNGKVVELSEARVVAKDTTLTARGAIGPTARDVNITAKASSFNAALAQPFMPAGFPVLSGVLALDVTTSPGGDLPELDMTIRDTGGGLSLDKTRIDNLDADLKLKRGKLTLSRCNLRVGTSKLSLTGSLDIESLKDKQAIPLDAELETTQFNLANLRTFIPDEYASYRAMVPGGELTCKVRLKGTTEDPRVNADLDFNLYDLPSIVPVFIQRASGQVRIANNDFDIQKVELQVQAGQGLQSLRAPVTGSGSFSLNPPALTSGQVDIALAPGGQFTPVTLLSEADKADGRTLPYPGVQNFWGTLGGLVSVKPIGKVSLGGPAAIITGSLVINAPDQTSQLQLRIPEERTGSEQSVTPFVFQDFQVVVNRGTSFKLSKPEIEAELHGQVTLDGRPGLPDRDPITGKANPDALRINGTLNLPKGTLFIPALRNPLRLDEGFDNRARFDSNDPRSTGNLRHWPALTFKALMVIPNVLAEAQSTGLGELQSGMQRGARDLTVYFTYVDVMLDPDLDMLESVQLSSSPPRSQDEIRQYLLSSYGSGDMINVLRGEGELSDLAQSQLVGYGSSFISQAIEDALGLDAFRLGGSGSEDNPYYVDLEKAVSPEVSLTYFRNFYSETNQSEEFGMRYNILKEQTGYQNVDLVLNFQLEGPGAGSGTGAEFMFQWTTKF